jgi:glycosyltransferase involved in cell wall biosynthesis
MLAILATHPIQNQVPLWQALAREGSIPLEVWYLSDHGTRPSFDREFGKRFSWDVETLSGYPHRFLNGSENADVQNFLKARVREPLRKLFRDRGVKAVWVQGWQVAAYWQAVWQAHDAGIPVWLRGDSNDLASVPFFKNIAKRLLLDQFFRRTDQFLYVGEANRRFYEAYGIRAEQLHPAPHCVDNERFALQSESLRNDRNSIRSEWKVPDDAYCILFAGKFIPKKRPFDLIAAVRQCEQRQFNRPLHILFAGSGELGADLRKACHVVFDAEHPEMNGRLNAPRGSNRPRASFVGFLNQTEISKAYVAADCKVLPSDTRETWGLVINEALASGLPCIVSDACGCSEDLISPLNPGFRFPLGDIGAIVDALLLLSESPCPSSALRKHVSKFSVDATVETVKRLYHSSS